MNKMISTDFQACSIAIVFRTESRLTHASIHSEVPVIVYAFSMSLEHTHVHIICIVHRLAQNRTPKFTNNKLKAAQI